MRRSDRFFGRAIPDDMDEFMETRMKHCFAVSCVALTLLSSIGTRADTVDCDVIVVGGGTAGVVATIQSARCGAKTILIEAGSQLGGNATVGGVNSPELFSLWGKQRIAGIGWEWCVKTAELDNKQLPGSRKHYRINPPLYACIAEELCLKAGAEVRYFESPMSVKKNGDPKNACHWILTTAAMGETRTLRCKELVDCTGNGTLCALAGAERMREKEIMAGSFNYVIKHEVSLKKLGKDELQRRYEDALKDGRLIEGDARHGIESSMYYQAGNYIYDADNSTAALRTQTNIRGRQSALRMLRFIRSLPGGETATITTMFPEVGVRETWRVKGEYVVTVDDYLAGKTWEDSICYACYQIDMHKPLWKDFVRIHLKEGILPTVPLRALIPLGVDHLMVAGRCISSDRLAMSALRIQATCMGTGQAAGAAAALAVKHATTPLKVDLAELKALLKRNDAIIP